jgi:hypothetical protein
VAALERAVRRAPAFADACDLLARLSSHPYDERVRMLEAAIAANPGRADLGITLGGLLAEQDDLAGAARAFAAARHVARDDTERFLCDHLLARIRANGQQELRGTLVAVDCPKGGLLAFRVRGPNGVRTLRPASANAVFLYGRDGEPVIRTFTCGPQDAPVVARYRANGAGADDTLLSLRFR